MASSGHGILGRRRRLVMLLLLPLLAGAAGYGVWSRFGAGPVDPARVGILYVAAPGGADIWAQTAATRPMSGEAAAAELDLRWQREVHNHAAMIASLHNYKRVARDYSTLSLRDTKWFKQRANPADVLLWLNRHVHAEVLPGTSLIQISVDDRGHDCSDQDAAAIVRAVGDNYIRDYFLNVVLENNRANRGQFIALKIKYAAELDKAEVKLGAMSVIPVEDRQPDFEFRREKTQWEFAHAREALADVQRVLDRLDVLGDTQSSDVQWRSRPSTGE